MKDCASCVDWNRDDWRARVNSRDGREWGVCVRLSDLEDGQAAERTAEASCFAEGIQGELMTTAVFGCTEWSQKGVPA